MKWMMYLMPLMFLFWFNDYASGLSYYYFISLLITIIQTFAMRFFIDEDKLLAKIKEKANKPMDKKTWVSRLAEMQEQMKQQQAQNGKK
jgi:YidC/Oxa1 family membrane protein insertase